MMSINELENIMAERSRTRPLPVSGEPVVIAWEQDGHSFRIERLEEPVQRGATLRTHRLYCDGEPALGGQWHTSVESAQERASYICQSTLYSRIRWLENRLWGDDSTSALGMPIDARDRHGDPIHVGDRLRFDPAEWGGSTGNVFTIEVSEGEIIMIGAPGDLDQYCEILTKFDGRKVRD